MYVLNAQGHSGCCCVISEVHNHVSWLLPGRILKQQINHHFWSWFQMFDVQEPFMHTWRIVLFHLLCAPPMDVLCDHFCWSSSHCGSWLSSTGPTSGDMRSVGNGYSAEHARLKFWLTMSPVVLEQVGSVYRRSSVCVVWPGTQLTGGVQVYTALLSGLDIPPHSNSHKQISYCKVNNFWRLHDF